MVMLGIGKLWKHRAKPMAKEISQGMAEPSSSEHFGSENGIVLRLRFRGKSSSCIRWRAALIKDASHE
jgi:hypothetical protein